VPSHFNWTLSQCTYGKHALPTCLHNSAIHQGVAADAENKFIIITSQTVTTAVTGIFRVPIQISFKPSVNPTNMQLH
jgi:hypothetical protein